MQSRSLSLLEACTNAIVGLVVSLSAQLILLPLLGIHADLDKNIALAVSLTFFSVVKTYAVRRTFTKWE
jgi:hypothetical protein